LGPPEELPDATADSPRIVVSVARSPAAERGTALWAKPALQASSVQWGRLVMQVRDRSPEAWLPPSSPPARSLIAAHQASSDRPGSVREVSSPEQLALVAALAMLTNALLARRC
jgi:hypothetical protein